MLKKIGLVLLAAIAVVLVLAATKPDTFTVTRSVVVRAAPEKLYPLVADFHQWGRWSPWEHLDPNMKRAFEGAAVGPGAVYTWDGNKDVGAGRMEITAAQPPRQVDIRLDFLRPFASQNTTTFAFAPAKDGTTVTWTMQGPMPFVSKLMTVFFSMDAMIGKDFERGLANLKAVAER